MGKMVGSEFKPGDDRTIFMDTYAMQAKWHMWKYGTTQAQIAAGAAKNHNYGALNDKAQYRFQMTPQSVMEDRPVSYPLTRAMCAPIGDGAAAALLCSAEYLEKLPASVKERAIKIAGVGFSGGKYRSLDEPGLTRAASDKAYKMAGLGPQDIDVAEVHDATSFCEIYQCEMLRFCPEGEGGKFIESGATGPGGRLPVNTSGGLVSKGHPVGATGLSMLAELATAAARRGGPAPGQGRRDRSGRERRRRDRHGGGGRLRRDSAKGLSKRKEDNDDSFRQPRRHRHRRGQWAGPLACDAAGQPRRQGGGERSGRRGRLARAAIMPPPTRSSAEIKAAGGQAVPNYDSVADPRARPTSSRPPSIPSARSTSS